MGFLDPFVAPRVASSLPIFRSVDISERDIRLTPAPEASKMFRFGDPSPGSLPYGNCISRFGDNIVASTGSEVHMIGVGDSKWIEGPCGGSRIVETIGSEWQGEFGLSRLEDGTISSFTSSSEEIRMHGKYSMASHVGVSSVAGTYSVSEGLNLSVFGCEDSSKPNFSFPQLPSVGPVEYLPHNPDVMLHGGSNSLSFLDLRSAAIIQGSVSVHPGCVSATAYTVEMNYSLVSVSPVSEYQIAAVSSMHNVVQIFDSRKQSSALLAEFSIPGRENIISRPMIPCPWKRLEFSRDGAALLLVRPGNIQGACVLNVSPLSPISVVPLCPSREDQINEYNERMRVSALQTKNAPKTMEYSGILSCPDGFFEISLGATFNTTSSSREIISVTSKGRILVIKNSTSKGTEKKNFMPPPKSWFNLSSNTSPDLSLVVAPPLQLLQVEASRQQHLYQYEQVWIQCFVGTCRGLRKCIKHGKASRSKIGSARWMECMQSKECAVRLKPGPPESAYNGQVRFTHLSSLILAYGSTFGRLVNVHKVKEYLQYLQSSACEWCEASFDESSECFKVTVREKKNSRELVEKNFHEKNNDMEMEIFSDNEDQDGNMFDQRKQVVATSRLVVKSVVVADHLNIIHTNLIENLREMYPNTQNNKRHFAELTLTTTMSDQDDGETQPPIVSPQSTSRSKKIMAGF